MPKLQHDYCYISYYKLENPNGKSVRLLFPLNIEEQKSKKDKILNFNELFELFSHYRGGQGWKLGSHHDIMGHVIQPLPLQVMVLECVT